MVRIWGTVQPVSRTAITRLVGAITFLGSVAGILVIFLIAQPDGNHPGPLIWLGAVLTATAIMGIVAWVFGEV